MAKSNGLVHFSPLFRGIQQRTEGALDLAFLTLVLFKPTFRLVEIVRRVPTRLLPRREPIAQIRETVGRRILDLEIFVPRTIQHVEPMDAASRVKGHHGSVDLPVLEPRATARTPGGPRHEFCDVVVEVTHRPWRRTQGPNPLRLNLFQHIDHVLRGVFDNGKHRTVTNGSVGSEEHWTYCS